MIILAILGLVLVIAGILVLGVSETQALSAVNEHDLYHEIERWVAHMIGGILLLMCGIALLGYVAGHL